MQITLNHLSYYQFNPYKVSSIYGLLSTTPIIDKLKSSHLITLPFFSGCKYVAYQAGVAEKVRIIDFYILNEIFFKGRSSHLVWQKARFPSVSLSQFAHLGHEGKKQNIVQFWQISFNFLELSMWSDQFWWCWWNTQK